MSFHPESQNEQAPGLLRVSRNEALNASEVEQVEDPLAAITEDVPFQSGHGWCLKPRGHGAAKTLLGAGADFGRPHDFVSAPQWKFLTIRVNLQAVREGQAKTSQVHIEEGSPQFQAVGHGGSICLDEDVAGQIEVDVEAERIADACSAGSGSNR